VEKPQTNALSANSLNALSDNNINASEYETTISLEDPTKEEKK